MTRAAWLAAVAALAGAGLAVASIVRRPADPLPPTAVAVVNDVPLSRDELARSLQALAADRRDGVGKPEQRLVLERMIDEELLLQRALALGLARHERTVRGPLVSAMLAAITADADTAAADEATLRRFYENDRAVFAETARLRARQVFVAVPPGTDAGAPRRRAEAAAAALRAGEPFAAVRARYGDPEPVPLPDALLPPEKLRDYLGPTAMRTALELSPGDVGGPVRSAEGVHVLQVVERQPGTIPPFEAVRPLVEAEWRRRAGEAAVRDYLARLRAEARLVVAPEVP